MVCTVYSTRLHLTWSVQTLPGCSSHGLNQAVAHMVCTVYSTLLHLIWSIQYRVVSDMVCAIQAASDMFCTVHGCIWHGLCSIRLHLTCSAQYTVVQYLTWSVQYQAVSDMFFSRSFIFRKFENYIQTIVYSLCVCWLGPALVKNILHLFDYLK